MSADVQTALALALSIGAVSFTVSSTKISAPFRVWLAKHKKTRIIEHPSGKWEDREFETYGFVKWLSDLVSCPYCLSHWLAFAATALYRPFVVRLFWPVDFLVTSMAITAVAMLPVLVIRKALMK